MSEQIKNSETGEIAPSITAPGELTIEVGCKISRNYGQTTVEFQCREVVHVASKAELQSRYDILVKRINDQFANFETYSQMSIVNPVPDEGKYKRLSEPQKYTLHSLVVEVKDGKRLVKAKTREAQYNKFGIPIYEEVMKEYNIDGLLGDRYQVSFGDRVVSLYMDSSTKNKKVIAFDNLPASS